MVRQLVIPLFEEEQRHGDRWSHENHFWSKGYAAIAGIDEVGRGPLCGPVVAAAVVFAPGTRLDGLDDSKKLSARVRERLDTLIRRDCLAKGIGLASPAEIDAINILEATRLAMMRAIRQLSPSPDLLLIDAVALPEPAIPYRSIIRGDSLVASISAASIVAKVARDRLMASWHRRFPCYGLDRNKGYGTREHLAAIRQFGPCPLHRRTFRGVREYC